MLTCGEYPETQRIMKKKIAILCLLFLSCLLTAQENSPVMFINTNSHHGEEIGPAKGLSQFAEIAIEVGYQVRSGWHWNITESSMEGLDLYILPEYVQGITASEKKVLKDYVKGGGSLLILTWYKEPGNLKSLMTDFGIVYGATDPYHRKGKVTAFSGLTKPRKCNSLYFGYRRFIEPLNQKDAISAAQDALGKSVVVLSKSKNLGLGKVAICGDLSQFISSSYPEGNIKKADNSAFVYNLLWHLQAAQDLAFTKVKPVKTEIKSGSKITLKTIIKNIGDLPSTKTTVHIFLAKDKEPDPLEENLIFLRKIKLPVVKPGKKIRFKWKLPTKSATPGEYYLLLWLDKNNNRKEKRRDNNIIYSKYSITISD